MRALVAADESRPPGVPDGWISDAELEDELAQLAEVEVDEQVSDAMSELLTTLIVDVPDFGRRARVRTKDEERAIRAASEHLCRQLVLSRRRDLLRSRPLRVQSGLQRRRPSGRHGRRRRPLAVRQSRRGPPSADDGELHPPRSALPDGKAA